VTPRFTGRPSDGCSAGPIGANERRREVSASDVSVATREPRPGSSLPPDDTPSRSARALRAGQSDRASRSRSAHPSPIRGTRRAPSVRSRPGSSGGPGQSGHPWSDAAASPRHRRDAANPLEPRGMRARHRGDRGSSTSRDVILERSWNARAASGGNRRRGQVGVNPPSATNRDQWGPTASPRTEFASRRSPVRSIIDLQGFSAATAGSKWRRTPPAAVLASGRTAISFTAWAYTPGSVYPNAALWIDSRHVDGRLDVGPDKG
jgi:hypothetical protein